MKIWLILGALVAAFYVDRVAAVAEPASGGPIMQAIGACDLPQPSDKAAMLFASYYEGAAVSPIRLGEGKQSDTTSVVNVTVQRGVGPLYVVIAGSRHSVINVSGWTRRIERLVVATRPQFPIAVTGLPVDKILFVDRNSCGGTIPLDDLYKFANSNQDMSSVSMVVQRPFPESMSAEERSKQKTEYRMPDAIGGAYEPERLSLSEFGIGATEYRPHTHGSVPSWFLNASAAADYHPAGVGEVEWGGLVTPVAVAPYRVLPDRAGIAQLMHEGKIEGHYNGDYRILAPIGLPEGLCGSLSAKFTLAPGVPAPSGDLCHSELR